MQRIKIPLRQADGRAARRAGRRAPRSTRTGSCTSPPARTSSCTSSTSRTRPTCSAGWRRSASPRARRAATPSATSPPARIAGVCRDRGVRRRALRARADATSCSATTTRRTSGASSRSRSRAASDNACGLTNFHDIGAIARTREVNGETERGFELVRRRRPRRGAAERAAVRRVPARGGAAADRAGDEPRVRAAGREGEPRARAPQVRRQEAGHRGVQAPGAARSARSCAPIRAGRRSWRTCTPPTRSRCARRAAARGGRIPRASRRGARPTSSRSARRATSWRPSRCRSAI